jgi:hypothetical protein
VRLAQLADRGVLEVGQRVAVVRRGELAHELLARLDHRPGDQLAHAVLHRGGAAVREQLLELAGQLAVLGGEDGIHLFAEELGHGAGAVAELPLQLARGALELGPHEVGVGRGLLAIENAGADLDGVHDRAGGILRRLLALPHQPNRGLVLDHERVDGHAVADRPDVGLAEWGGRFHGVAVAP